jgi:hypothetical protein
MKEAVCHGSDGNLGIKKERCLLCREEENKMCLLKCKISQRWREELLSNWCHSMNERIAYM